MVVILLFLHLALSQFKEEDDVIVLDDQNFDKALESYPQLLVEFYAPWCKFCQHLAPLYAKAAQRLKKEDPPIRIAKIDASAFVESAEKYNIEGYPTLKFFSNGVPTEYTGVKNEEGIVSWLIKRIGPPAKVLESKEALSYFIENNEISVVLFSKDREEQSFYEKVAKNSEGNFYGICPNDQIWGQYAEKPALVMFKDKDNRKSEFFGPFTEVEILKFIEKNLVPWILPFDDKVIQLVFKKQNPALFVFRKEIDSHKYADTLESLSKSLKGFPLITYADLDSSSNKRLVEFLGLPVNWMPFALIVNEKSDKFVSKSDLSLESLKKFVDGWKNGSEKKYFKSQPVPPASHENDVRILVGENFADIAFDPNFDVLVEFYAPWCGHCKKLLPEYTKLAKKFKEAKTLIVAKIDATENEIENFDIQKFPTIKFFPANKKGGIDYNGEKTADGLEQFILANAALDIRKVEL